MSDGADRGREDSGEHGKGSKHVLTYTALCRGQPSTEPGFSAASCWEDEQPV